jgi:Tfp pilus assembly protein PilF/TolB-like protein
LLLTCFPDFRTRFLETYVGLKTNNGPRNCDAEAASITRIIAAMPAIRNFCAVLAVVLCTVVFSAAQNETGGDTLVVLPFENRSQAPGLDWIGEAFPEVLSQRLGSPDLFAISRESREYAFERLGIPSNTKLSRATLYRIAEQMDVDEVVVGSFTYDGSIFTARSQLLNMRTLRLSAEQVESGPLSKLIEVMTALTWDMQRLSAPALTTSRNDFIASWPPIRLDAFENYIRGVTASGKEEQTARLREAVRLNPNFSQALLALGKLLYESRDYQTAASTLARVNRSEPASLEANFYFGLAAFYSNDMDRAENAFAYVGSLLPLAEVANNRGVTIARRGKRSGMEFFQRAAKDDPKDPDYHFNLAVALAREGNSDEACKHLKETVALRGSDEEAKSLLDTLTASSSSAPARLPLERIKTKYDENSFRQMEWQIRNANEERMTHADAATHARFHVDRGNQMLSQGFVLEAEKEFRDAIAHDPSLPESHTGLAQSLETWSASAPSASLVEGARAEAHTSIRLKPTVDAYLVLARLDMRENKLDTASASVSEALALEPKHDGALAMKRTIDARIAQSRPAE